MQPTISSRRSLLQLCVVTVLLGTAFPPTSKGQEPDTGRLPGLQWRLIGPFRAGRVTAVAGVPNDPNIFYFGTPGGGAWKTSDGGQVWKPSFDKERVASIGALTVAPSDPRVVYLGTGEQTRGHGLYRSSDGGATWKNAGLEHLLFIQAIVVDPHDPNVVIVGGNSLGFGILWHPLPSWADTANRGIFKTTDGGKNWKKVFGQPHRSTHAVCGGISPGFRFGRVADRSDFGNHQIRRRRLNLGASTKQRVAGESAQANWHCGRGGNGWTALVRDHGSRLLSFRRWRRELAAVYERSTCGWR